MHEPGVLEHGQTVVKVVVRVIVGRALVLLVTGGIGEL